MKRRVFACLLMAVVTFGLCACEKISSIELPPLPTVTPQPAEPEARPEGEATSAPMETGSAHGLIVSIKRSVRKAYDPHDGSKLILTFSYDTPAVFMEGNEAAASAINEQTALLEDAFYTGSGYGTGYNDMLTMAEDNYNFIVSNGIEGGMYELVSSRTVSVERMDAQVLTLLYNDYSYTGGVHGFYGDTGYSFDAETGKLLSLEDLSGDYEALASFLVAYMVNTVENDPELAQRIDLGLYEAGTAYGDILAPLLRQGSWYFDGQGLVIFSSLYEISSYAAGPVFFHIPYAELQGHVDEQWLPEEIQGSGSLELVAGGEMLPDSTPIIDKLDVDAEGESLYLIVRGSVKNLRIAKGEYVNSFYATEELWNCSSMDNCALQLQYLIPEGMPNLRISYDDETGSHSFFLSHSGADGSVILTDAVEAVG
ncbi:MAG: DUF3298 domain-containing protein [Candidatus Limivicinus sp.]